MIDKLQRLIDHIEAHLTEELRVSELARSLGTTEYHLRRMFSSLVGMPVSEYIRRRRMTAAASDLLAGMPVLDTAVRYGYGSSEAFGRAFRSVHGASPAQIRRTGGPLQSQPKLRLRLAVERSNAMETRIVEQQAFRLVGHSARVPLIHRGVNPHIQALIRSLPAEEHSRLKRLSGFEPAGLLQVSNEVDPDYREGTELTYLHGVAVPHGVDVPDDLDMIEVSAGTWAVFRASGPYPSAVQDSFAASASDWFPSNPWRLRPGPSIVAVLDRTPDFATATTELWLPIEPAA